MTEKTSFEPSKPPSGEFPLHSEYARCLQVLKKTRIVQPLKDGETVGIVGHDKTEFPIPTEQQVAELFEKNKDVLDKKITQGFTRLQLTPFGMPLKTLVRRVGQAIVRHSESGELFIPGHGSDWLNKPVRVSNEQYKNPFWEENPTDPEYLHAVYAQETEEAEKDGRTVYFPENLDVDHKGLNYERMMQVICPVPGWGISLNQDRQAFPQRGEEIMIGDRKQFPVGKTVDTYFNLLLKPEYEGEAFWTDRDFLINFLANLEEASLILPPGPAALLGNVFTEKNHSALVVPFGEWDLKDLRLKISSTYEKILYQPTMAELNNTRVYSTVRLTV